MEEKKETETPEAGEEQQKAAEAPEETSEEVLEEEETAEEAEEEGAEAEVVKETEETVKAEEEATELAEEAPAEAEKEEVAPSKREKAKKEEEEEVVEERVYTVPLARAWIGPPRKRAPRAMRILQGFVVKHMKLDKRKEGEEEEEEEAGRLVVENEVNEHIWSRGIEKPPRKVRVRVTKDKEGNVTVHLAEGD
jgi:large subunit ribosomal protein L31e